MPEHESKGASLVTQSCNGIPKVDWQISGITGGEIQLKKQVSTLELIRTGYITCHTPFFFWLIDSVASLVSPPRLLLIWATRGIIYLIKSSVFVFQDLIVLPEFSSNMSRWHGLPKIGHSQTHWPGSNKFNLLNIFSRVEVLYNSPRAGTSGIQLPGNFGRKKLLCAKKSLS